MKARNFSAVLASRTTLSTNAQRIEIVTVGFVIDAIPLIGPLRMD